MSTTATTTAAPTFRDNFDLLRLFVSVLVLVRHCMGRLEIGEPWWWWIIDVFPGVPIFFVVSGFLVSASFERSANVATYANSRVRRIFPGLWACVLLTVIAAMAFGFDFFHPAGLAWLLAQMAGLIYTPAFLEAFGSGTYNGALWTIPVSLQFYVLLPLLYWLLGPRRTNRNGFFVLWLVSLALALVFRPMIATGDGQVETLELKLLRYSIVPHLYLFLLGIVLQKARLHESPAVRGKVLPWLAGYLLLMAVVPETDVKDVLQPVLLAVVALSFAYTAPGLSRGTLRRHDVSYGVFIYHGLVINVFVELGFTGSPLHAAGVAVVTLVISWLSWHYVESPFLSRRRQALRAVPAAGKT